MLFLLCQLFEMIFISNNHINRQSECQKKWNNMNGRQNAAKSDFGKVKENTGNLYSSYSLKNFRFRSVFVVFCLKGMNNHKLET